MKDESQNPTGSFKSRGMSAAVTVAKRLGVTALVAPSAGNAGGALAAYGARAGIGGARLRTARYAAAARRRDGELRRPRSILVDGSDRRRRTDGGSEYARAERAPSTLRRSANRTASRERRRWASSWSSNSAAFPARSSIRPAAARAWSRCGRRLPSWSALGWIGARASRDGRASKPRAAHRSFALSIAAKRSAARGR